MFTACEPSFSCSGDDDWGCMSRWHHMEGGTIYAAPLPLRLELQFPSWLLRSLCLLSTFSFSWGGPGSLSWEAEAFVREARVALWIKPPNEGRGCSACQPGSRLCLADREAQIRGSALGRMRSREMGRSCLAEWEGWERPGRALRGRETLEPDTGPARSGCLLSFPGVKSKWHSYGAGARTADAREAAQRVEAGATHAGVTPLPYSPWTAESLASPAPQSPPLCCGALLALTPTE